MTNEISLAWLLQPLSVETFLTEIWGTREHLVERRRSDHFTGLIDAAAIEAHLEYGRPELSAVRLVRRDDKKEPGAYRFADGGVDSVRIRNDFAEGYTIVLNGLERYIPSIAA